ncbi:hypothetical protein AGMMS49957_14260 [Synergistales bacterium]|nr:hypothetical protein AGMMS49957_14260 [Synergistales bacterium]
MITLPEEINLAIRAEGERTYPNECCGFIFGKSEERGEDTYRSATEILPIDNAREAEERHHRFVIGPDDFMAAEREARKKGLDVLGFYHSHPNWFSRPSDYDREHALPFYSYVILSVERGRAAELTSWELTSDRELFVQEL